MKKKDNERSENESVFIQEIVFTPDGEGIDIELSDATTGEREDGHNGNFHKNTRMGGKEKMKNNSRESDVKKYEESLKELKKDFGVTDDLYNVNLKVNQNFEDEDKKKVEGRKVEGPFLGNKLEEEGRHLTEEEMKNLNLSDFSGKEYEKDMDNPSEKMTDDLKNYNFKVDKEFHEENMKRAEKYGKSPENLGNVLSESENKEQKNFDEWDKTGRKTIDKDNADYLINPEGKVEDLEPRKERNTANERAVPGQNAPDIEEASVKNLKDEKDCYCEEKVFADTESIIAGKNSCEEDFVADYRVHPESGAENLKPEEEINVDEGFEGAAILKRESYDLSIQEKIEYEPSVEVDDGDIYDEAIDVRELHKDDKDLVDGWISENPAERDRRIEKHMEEHGRILDGKDPIK